MINTRAAAGSQGGSVADVRHVRGGGSAVVAKDGVELLGDSDESRPAAQFLQLAGSNVGAGGANPSQDVSYGLVHRPFVRDFHRLPL